MKRKLEKLMIIDSESSKKVIKLTLLKKFSHSVQPHAIKLNVEQLLMLKELFFELEEVILKLDLSQEGIHYFANYVLRSPT
jgi:hypothetical protein